MRPYGIGAATAPDPEALDGPPERSHLQRASDLELAVVDEPADRFQDRVFRLVPRGVDPPGPGFVDAGVLSADEVLPAPLAVVLGGPAPELFPGHRVQVGFPAEP